ncbi:MAG: hypothetical protein KDF60_12050 [Calditrichaeota bacterium]|nr:hypothetical protein [Calditrichota bacterium]
MRYCPYCSAPVSENALTCHECKRNLDFNKLADVIEAGEDSQVNKKAIRKIWLKEHAIYIWPVITLLIGFITGGIILYLVALGQFAAEKESLNSEIVKLKSHITNINSNSQDVQSGFEDQLKAKDQIISILTDQRTSLTRIINFTRRMAENSILTPNNAEEASSFQRNFRYLERQFNQQQDQLNNTKFENNQNFNLETLPQFLQE